MAIPDMDGFSAIQRRVRSSLIGWQAEEAVAKLVSIIADLINARLTGNRI